MAFTVAELVTRLGFTIDSNALMSYKKSIDQMATQTINNVSKITAGLGAAIIGITAHTFANFEAGLNELTAVTGATGAELKNLEKQALDLGKSTKFSAQDVLGGQIALSRAGFKTKETLEAMSGVTTLSAASNITLAESASVAANTLRGFGLEANEMSRVADVLAVTTKESNQQISDLAESMKFVAPIARGAGQSLEHTAGLLGILANNGLRGTVAATGLNQIMSRLANPKFRKEFEDLGVSVKDEAGNFRELNDILTDVKKETEKVSQVEAAAIRLRLFGQIGQKSAAAIMQTSIEQQNKIFEAIKKSNGVAKQMAEIMNKGLIPEFLRLKAALEGVFLEFGKRFAPAITAGLKALQGVLNFISNLSPVTLDIIANLILLATTVSGLVATFTGIKLAFAAFGGALAPLGAAIGGITGAGVAMAAVFVGAIALIALIAQDVYTFFQGGDSVIGRFINKFPVFFGTIKEVFIKIIDGFKAMAFIGGLVFDKIASFASEKFTQMSNFIEAFMIRFFIITGIGKLIADVINKISEIWSEVFNVHLPAIVDSFVNYIVERFNKIFGLFKDLGSYVKVAGNFFFGEEAQKAFNPESNRPSQPKFDKEAFLKNLKETRPDLVLSGVNRIAQRENVPLDVAANIANSQGSAARAANTEQNNQIQISNTINVGGSDATASEIASKTGAATGDSTNKALASAYRNLPDKES